MYEKFNEMSLEELFGLGLSEELLKEKNVEIPYFTGPSQYSLYLEHTDFIITVPDVSHRENLEFPEWAKFEPY